MTEQEAIEVIKKADAHSIEAIEELKTIKDKAIALDKYGEYYSVLQNCLREREACAVAVKAIEKQIAKKLKQTKDGSFACECGLVVQVKNKTNCLYYCHSCGQKIDWGK